MNEIRYKQLELEIGQQKTTLSDWKKDNNIFTIDTPCHWICWNEIEDYEEFLSKYGDAGRYGDTEKEAIIKFCHEKKLNCLFTGRII